MKITKTYNWNRRDFCFDATCEHCSNVKKDLSGYDDSNYYDNVVPNMKCDKCGESTKSKPIEGILETRTIPKYNPNLTI